MKLLLLFHTNNNENKHTEYKQRQKPSQGKKMTNQAPSTGIRLLLFFFLTIFLNTNQPSVHTKLVNPLTETAFLLKPLSRVI